MRPRTRDLSTLLPLLVLSGSLACLGCGDGAAGVRYDAGPVPMPDCDPPSNRGACNRDSDCSDGALCGRDPAAEPQDLEPVVLACRAPGLGAAPLSPCESASGCAHGLCVVAGTCVEPCQRDVDCAPDSHCAAVHVRTAGEALERARGCVPVVSSPPDVTVTRTPIDALEWGRGSFEVPLVGGASLAVVVPACNARGLVTGLRTRDAAPMTLFDYGAGIARMTQANWIDEKANPISILVPTSPTGPTSEAGYALRVQSDGAGDATLFSFARSARGTRLDVDLFYVGAMGWAPTGERGPPEVDAALSTLETYLTAAGLELGEVRQHAVTGALRGRFAILETGQRPDEEDELAPLFALSAGARGPAIPIFLVRTIIGAVGRAGGIPGPAGLPGTSASGVVIGPDLVPQATFERALSHEALHYLGLFHTTEADGRILRESIEDTPACPPENDIDGDGFLSPSECVGRGAENLMFWAASGDELSFQQGELVADTLLAR